MPVDIFDLEMANSGYQLMDVFATHPFRKMLSAGVVDVHSHRIEGPEEVAEGVRKVLAQFPADKSDGGPGLRSQDPDGG